MGRHGLLVAHLDPAGMTDGREERALDR